MLTTYCGNCGQSKTPETYADPYCAGCVTAKSEAREHAIREGQDVSAAVRNALLRRAQHLNSGHADPRAPWNPGLRDSRTGGLGMDAHVPPDRTLTPNEGA
jgi:hypothetical protein